MQASLAQITQIKVFADLETTDKLNLQPYTVVKPYGKGEIIFFMKVIPYPLNCMLLLVE
jgi:hypothetical protein